MAWRTQFMVPVQVTWDGELHLLVRKLVFRRVESVPTMKLTKSDADGLSEVTQLQGQCFSVAATRQSSGEYRWFSNPRMMSGLLARQRWVCLRWMGKGTNASMPRHGLQIS